jgi:hypothetical protein
VDRTINPLKTLLAMPTNFPTSSLPASKESLTFVGAGIKEATDSTAVDEARSEKAPSERRLGYASRVLYSGI